MDREDDLSEPPVRTSPRFSRKDHGKKNSAVEDLSDDSSVDRPRKKRKYQKVGVTSKKDKGRKSKQNIGFKCCPHMLHDLFNRLDETQKEWVEQLGFGVLLPMPKCRLPKALTVWLINQVSWKRKALIIGGKCIKIKSLIKKVLGIPDGHLPVPLPRSGRGKSKVTNPTEEEKLFKDEKAGRGLDYKTIFESLISQHDPVQFKISFMLYVLCIYFAPSSGHVINRSYIPIIRNVDLIKDMNWCEHVADFLIEGIREYRESSAANVNVHGCVHVLLLIYIDLVRSELIKIPEGVPRANFVDSELLEQLDSLDLKHISTNGPEYGKLELDVSQFPDYVRKKKNMKPGPAEPHYGAIPPSRDSNADFSTQKKTQKKLKKIELDYVLEREKIYDHCFKQLRSKMKDLDAARSCAIQALFASACSTSVVDNSEKKDFAAGQSFHVPCNVQSSVIIQTPNRLLECPHIGNDVNTINEVEMEQNVPEASTEMPAEDGSSSEQSDSLNLASEDPATDQGENKLTEPLFPGIHGQTTSSYDSSQQMDANEVTKVSPCEEQAAGVDVLAEVASIGIEASQQAIIDSSALAKKPRLDLTLLLLPPSGPPVVKHAIVVRQPAGAIVTAEHSPRMEVALRMDVTVLHCPICPRPFKPPVFQCKRGHLACGGCLAGECGKCEDGGVAFDVPNTAMDGVVSAARMECPYNGCEKYVAYHELQDHQNACLHAPCWCAEPGCGFVGPAPALVAHLAAAHAMPVHKVPYSKDQCIQVTVPPEPPARRLLVGAEDEGGAFLLTLDALGAATVVTVVCIRAEACPLPRYTVKMWLNGPPPAPNRKTGMVLTDFEATSSATPGAVSFDDLASYLTVPPRYLVEGAGTFKELSLYVRIERTIY